MSEYPFDTLNLLPDKQVIYQKLNPTFHREYDIAVVLSTQRLCLWNGSWKTIALAEIDSVTLSTAPIHPMKWLLFGVLLALVLFGLISTVISTEFMFSGMALLMMVLMLGYFYLNGEGNRLTLEVQTKTSRHCFMTPPDTEESEIAYDQKMMQETLVSLKTVGIDTSDKTLPSTIT